MTLVIALNCKDGIIMASDGQATGGSSGGPIRHRIRKIFKLADNVLFGASGNVGIIQRSKEVVEQFAQQLSTDGLSARIKDQIRQQLFKIMKGELERHKSFHGKSEGAPLADTLICVWQDGSCKIWHIAPDCADEFLEELGYGCSGIGDTFAHTLLKTYYFGGLDVEGGQLVAYRVIKEAIEVGAFGLGGPVDVWVMSKSNGEIKQLTEEEIMALDDSHLTWKNMEREVFKKIKKGR